MMIGAYLAGILIILGFVTWVVFTCVNVKGSDGSDDDLGGELVTTPLEKFDSVRFSDINLTFNDDHWAINGFKGIKISVNDSVDTPRIVAPSDWMPLVGYKVEDGCLNVSIDADKLAKKSDYKGFGVIGTDSYCPVEIVMPEGSLKGACLDNSCTLYIEGLTSQKLNLNSMGRIVLIKCDIDTVIAPGDKNRFEELKLDDSRIEFAEISAPSSFKLNPVNDSSYVEILQLRRR